jgi:hypothetical protein
MALIAQVEPITIFHEVGVTLCCEIIRYDLVQTDCEVNWWLLNENGSQIYMDRWHVPQETLSVWGEDDTIIIQALADAKNFVIIP